MFRRSPRDSKFWLPPAASLSRHPRRRDVLALGGLAAAAGLVAGCGGPTVGDDNSRQEQATTDWDGVEPAERITWWSIHPGVTREFEQSLIDEFEAQHSGIEIELVSAGADYAEIAQRFQAASGTDQTPSLVGASDVWWFRYFVNGQIMPVDEVFAHLGVDTGDFVETFYEDYAYEGLHYAAPYARSTPLFYYNADLWAQAGLPDRGPDTWAELEEWSEALRRVVPDMGAPVGMGFASSWIYSSIGWGLGAALSDEWTVTLDTEESIAAGNLVRDMYNGSEAYVSFSTDLNEDFQAGVFASILGSTGSLTAHLEAATFEVGTAFLPGGPVQAPHVPTGGTGVAIVAEKDPSEQLAAAMFLAFLTDTDQAARFAAETGYIPVRTSAIEGDVMGQLYAETPQFRTAVDQLDHTRTQDWVRVFTPGGDEIITGGLEELILAGSGAEDVWPQVTSQLERAYAENVEPYL